MPLEQGGFGNLFEEVKQTSEQEIQSPETQEVSGLSGSVSRKIENTEYDREKFEDYFEKISGEEQGILEAIITKTNKGVLQEYIAQNGFIINRDTHLAFLQEFDINIQSETDRDISDGINEQNQVTDRQNQVEATQNQVTDTQNQVTDTQNQVTDTQNQVTDTQNLKEVQLSNEADLRKNAQEFLAIFADKQQSLGNIAGIGDIIHTGSQLDSMNTEQINALNASIQSFFQGLETNDQAFDKIAGSFVDPQEYETYKTFALEQNPALTAQFTRYENFRSINSPTPESELHRAQIVAGLDNNPLAAQKYGQFFELQEGENITVINAGIEPPSREVGIAGSSMRLTRNIPVGEFYGAIENQGLQYEAFTQTNNPTIDALSAIAGNKEAILETLEGDTQIEGANELGFGDISSLETQDIDDIKQDIEQQLGLPDGVTLDSLARQLGKTLKSRKDIADFVQSPELGNLLGALKNERESKRLAYQKALREKNIAVADSLQEGDMIARDAIESFYGLGIDRFWSEIQLLLNDPKVQSYLQAAIPNFSMQHIDLANGEFGQSGMQEDSMSIFRQNIASLANLIYTGSVSPENGVVDIGAFSKYSLGKVPGPSLKIQSLGEENGIIQSGAVNTVLIKKRLTGKT